MNGLSLLASCNPFIEPKSFKHGYVYDEKLGREEYMAIPVGEQINCDKTPDDEIINQLSEMLRPISIENIREHIGRLALLKKIGQASETTMPTIMQSMAFELAEFSELAILMGFREIKLDPHPWMPTLGDIVMTVGKCQNLLDKWLDIYREEKSDQLLISQSPNSNLASV